MPGFSPVAFTPVAWGASGPAALVLTADAGAYVVAGQAADLRIVRQLPVDTGVYTVAGQDVDLRRSFILSADTGVYVVTGQNVGLTKVRTLIADAGAYLLAGQDVGFSFTRVIQPETGAYVLSGQDVGLTIGYAPRVQKRVIVQSLNSGLPGSISVVSTDETVQKVIVQSIKRAF